MRIKFLKIIITFVIAFSANISHSEVLNYTKINVKEKVHLEIPDNWVINDADHRRKIKELAEQKFGQPIGHIASLSVSSYPLPSSMWIRVSFLPLKPQLTQTELLKELRLNKKEIIKDLSDLWKEESPAMWASMAKMGMTEVGQPSFTVEKIGGKMALVIRYGRTSINQPSKTVKVSQYHVPLGTEKALITLSYIEGNLDILEAHNYIKNSIFIQ